MKYQEIDKYQAINILLNNWLESFDNDVVSFDEWVSSVMLNGYIQKPLNDMTIEELQKEIDAHDIMADYESELYYKVIEELHANKNI